MAAISKLGRYELRRVLGKGAMGVVYEGYDPTLSRHVAVKTILKSVAIDDETERAYAERFVREAKAVARLNHPNIIQVHDFGVENEVAYLVMEYIEGRELRSYFEAKEAFGPAEAVRIMGELLDALEFAHESGVVHRDVKPANVMLDAQRRVKLADFGVARVQESARSTAGTMVGTPAFMSPEQISGGKIDRRSDIFSAGVILYQLLTGEQPFKGEGAWTVAKKIMQDDPPDPSSVMGSMSPAFDGIVNTALAKKPDNRFASAKEFAAALRGALGGSPQVGIPTRPRPETKPETKAKPEARASETELEFWRTIQNRDDLDELELYVEQYPSGAYAQLARLKIAKLRGPIDAARRESEEVESREAEEKIRREAEQQAKQVVAEKAKREAEEKARREAVEKVKREAEEKARQAQAKLKQQQEAAARARAAVDENATVAMGRAKTAAAPPSAQKKFIAILAAAAAVVIVGVAAYLILGKKPASAPVAEAPSAQTAPAPAVPAVDVEKIRRETEERLRKEFAEKAAVERAAMEKTVAEKLAAEKASAEKLAQAKTAAEKAEAEKAMQKAVAERAAAEKTIAEKAAAEQAKLDKVAADKAAAEKARADRAAAQKETAEKAASAVAKPGWPAVGDSWIYEVREAYPDNKYSATVEVRGVTAASVQDVFRTTNGRRVESVYKPGSALTSVAPGILEFLPYLRAFQEIHAGEKWSKVDITGVQSCAQMASCDASARVLGREHVSVKAESFEAWKIEVQLKWRSFGGQGTRLLYGIVTIHYWYSEQQRRIVKYQSRSTDSGGFGGWYEPDIDMELVSYVPAAVR